MISYTETLLLLLQAQDEHPEVKEYISQLASTKRPTVEMLKLINSYKSLDLYEFFEKIRKSYNTGHSKLYKNIVSDVEEPQLVLTTLASLQLQALIFAENIDNKLKFLQSLYFSDIQKAFNQYYETGDLILASKVLQVVKADIKVFEEFRK